MIVNKKAFRLFCWLVMDAIACVVRGEAATFTSWSAPANVASINSTDSDLSPYLSSDGFSLFFASTRPGGVGGEDLWVARRNSATEAFGAAVNLGTALNTTGAERSPALSPDGLSLYFASTRPGGSGGFDLWVSKRTDPNNNLGWQAPQNLGPLVNSSGVDAGPNYFFDPVTQNAFLYFASSRAGALDLYISPIAPDGAPGSSSPIAELNSSALDLTPAVRSDGLEIIFASNRSGATGLWMSSRERTSELWLPPVSLGAQFQIGSEAFPALSADGRELYFYSSRPGGSGSFDIYRSVRDEVPEPETIFLCGAGLLIVWCFRSRRSKATVPLIAALLGMGQWRAQADTVADWNSIMLNTIARQNSFAQARFAAITQLAVFEAVNSIEGRYQAYTGTVKANAGASADAAAIAAAHRVLRTLFAEQSSHLDSERERTLAGIVDGIAKAKGIEAGEAAADAMLALRATDNSAATMQYQPLTDAGFWQPTPPAFAQATFLHWSRVTPFGIRSAYQFAVPDPPAITSMQYARDYEEVKRFGSVASADRAQEQSDIAQFVAMTSPVQVWNRVATQLAAAQRTSLADHARTLALVNMSIMDSSVAVFALKYQFQTWRPVTAIRAGDIDGNSQTEGDVSFLPFIATPTFPGYPSAHASGGGAARYILERIFGRGRHAITLSNASLPGVTLNYSRLQQISDDVDDGRVYGGIHFRFDQEAGSLLGRRVGRYVFQQKLSPLR